MYGKTWAGLSWQLDCYLGVATHSDLTIYWLISFVYWIIKAETEFILYMYVTVFITQNIAKTYLRCIYVLFFWSMYMIFREQMLTRGLWYYLFVIFLCYCSYLLFNHCLFISYHQHIGTIIMAKRVCLFCVILGAMVLVLMFVWYYLSLHVIVFLCMYIYTN